MAENDDNLTSTAVVETEEVLAPGHTYRSVSDRISDMVLTWPVGYKWAAGLALAVAMLIVLHLALAVVFTIGVGVWGINIPVGWGFAITNFVWWIGIGHAGTLISAFLLLMRQKWRTSINRFAEAMTIFAVACAGLFPLAHMGRPWLFYWLLPYPDTMGVWPQFRSPLVWDVFAVSTYLTVSLVFWYTGLIPDLATLRDRAKKRATKIIYGIVSLGWRGSAEHWKRYEMCSLLLAGLSTPLVVSVHTVVSFDFTIAILPGWHSTIFPPYFVAGAIYSGFAMVLTLAIPLRRYYHLEDFVTMKHLDFMGKVMLATGLVVAYSYVMEAFMAFYSGSPYDRYMMMNRMTGPYAKVFWTLIFCNLVGPQALWFSKIRRHPWVLFAVSLVVQTGMWLERLVIIITSLHRDFLPSNWGMFYPTRWDYMTFIGTLGLFFTLFYLFIRFLPMIAIHELRDLVHKTEHEKAAAH
ncbi:MAG TPA: NrfD/PsrC family molybdoenzyme membrane anchor subunit [Terriglobia bacterium]|nr:NrfD/PsrC family molybdoenzyme membrane anchor subunit [Terriglobia bacterium]